MTEPTRGEHLAWCKQRALAELGSGSPAQISAAWFSMVSDLRKHPETTTHDSILPGTILATNGHLDTKDQMEQFLSGFE